MKKSSSKSGGKPRAKQQKTAPRKSKRQSSVLNSSSMYNKSQSNTSSRQLSMDVMVDKMKEREVVKSSRREKMREDSQSGRNLSSSRNSTINSTNRSQSQLSSSRGRSSVMSQSSSVRSNRRGSSSMSRKRKASQSLDEDTSDEGLSQSSQLSKKKGKQRNLSSMQTSHASDMDEESSIVRGKKSQKKKRTKRAGKENPEVVVTTTRWKSLHELLINYCKELLTANIGPVINIASRKHSSPQTLEDVQQHLNAFHTLFLRHLRQKTAPISKTTPNDYRNMEQQMKILTDIHAEYDEHNERLLQAIEVENGLADQLDEERDALEREMQSQPVEERVQDENQE